jgi:hypothetical protein
MRTRTLILALLALALSGPVRSQSSNGGGTIPSLDNVFGYNVVKHPDGSVTGQLEVRVLHTDVFVKGEYKCIDVVGGNFATASGVITQGDLAGLCFVASAQDNGEGANAPPDLISFLFFGPCSIIVPESACYELPQPAVVPIRGNLQVKP